MRLNIVLPIIVCFTLLTGGKITVDRYTKVRLPAVKNSASKIVTTKYYEGIYRNGEWICGKEIEPGDDFDDYLIDGDEPSIEYYNKAGNIVLYVATRSDKPIRFVETNYISQDDSRIDSKRYVSNMGGDITEEFIRDKDHRLLKIKSKDEETVYEYDSKGRRIKYVSIGRSKKTVWKRMPGNTETYSIAEYNLAWDNYRDGLEEERLEIYDANHNLIEESCKYYNERGLSWGSSQRLYKYVGKQLREETYYQHANDDSTWEKYNIKYNSYGNKIQEDIELAHTAGYRPLKYSRFYHYKHNSKKDWIQCTRILRDHTDPPMFPEARATIIVRDIVYK